MRKRFIAAFSFVSLLLTSSSTALADESVDDVVRKLLTSDYYTYTLGEPRKLPPDAILEIAYGTGHGFDLTWMRFRPVKDSVEVLLIEHDPGFRPFRSKWPSDDAIVTVKRARLEPTAYTNILRAIAAIDAAVLKKVERSGNSSLHRDFWSQARVSVGGKTRIEHDWAGYESSIDSVAAARSLAMTALARAANDNPLFLKAELTAEERRWASSKFSRDWKRFVKPDTLDWMRFRSVNIIGVAGDQTALSTLREVLDRPITSPSPSGLEIKDYCAYHAINAITRISGKDVRERPIEEMDVAKTRSRVIEMLDKLTTSSSPSSQSESP